jgi:hypothetical protein
LPKPYRAQTLLTAVGASLDAQLGVAQHADPERELHSSGLRRGES